MTRSRISRFLAAGSVPALAAGLATAQTLPLPSSNTQAYNGTLLAVTNTAIGAGPPIAIMGSALGVGIAGRATGAGGVAGRFQVVGTKLSSNATAVNALNAGGNTTTEGNYGSAGLFQSTNPKNMSSAVSVGTNGVNSHALYVVNSGGSDGKATYKNGDQGGVAAWFETTQPSWSSVLFSVNSADTGTRGPYGSAANFAITSTNNTSDAVDISTHTSLATGLNVDVGGSQGQGIQTYSYGDYGTGINIADLSTNGGTGIFAQSLKGTTAYFQSGQNGTNGHCAYTGGPGWSCSSDRNLKKDFQAADLADVLDRLDRMPVYYYHMKDSAAATRYLGPTAQDFHAAFAIGENDTTINTANAQGVALAAAKGLSEKLRRDEATIAQQSAMLARQDEKIATLERQLATLRTASVAGRDEAERIGRLEAIVARLAENGDLRHASLTQIPKAAGD